MRGKVVEKPYRVSVQIRRKAENYLDGEEFKTESYDSLDDLIQDAVSLIEETIYDDKEYMENNDDEN
jgi:hypothetical protein